MSTKNKNEVIKKDVYDHFMYETIRDASSVVKDMIKKTPEPNSTDALVSDVFSSFYKSSPEINEDSYGVPRNLVETMVGLQEYRDLRPTTRFDDVASALAVAKFAPDMIKVIEKHQKDKQDGKSDEEAQSGLRKGLRDALTKAQGDAEDWKEFIHSWGIDPADLKAMPHEEKMKLAEQALANRKLKDISKILGRLKNIVLSACAVNPVHGFDEVVDVITGDDIARMLPIEALKYKKTRTLFYKDMLERSLVQYNLRGVENMGNGPIVACLDISGSMSGPREVWAKAVCLALAFLAEKQKRDFALVTFEADVKHVKFFTRGKISLKDKVDIASIHSNGGGTNFYAPLMRSLKIIKGVSPEDAKKPTFKVADIVFVTDGECGFQGKELKTVLALKQELNTRIFGLGIGISHSGTLTSFCDNLSLVDDTGNIEHASGVLSTVSSSR